MKLKSLLPILLLTVMNASYAAKDYVISSGTINGKKQEAQFSLAEVANTTKKYNIECTITGRPGIAFQFLINEPSDDGFPLYVTYEYDGKPQITGNVYQLQDANEHRVTKIFHYFTPKAFIYFKWNHGLKASDSINYSCMVKYLPLHK